MTLNTTDYSNGVYLSNSSRMNVRNYGIYNLQFSAQLIGHLKNGEAGNIYIYPPILEQDCGQEYEYHIHKDTIEAYESGYGKNKRLLFTGSWLAVALLGGVPFLH